MKNRKNQVRSFIVQPYGKAVYICKPGIGVKEAEKVYKSLRLKTEVDFENDDEADAITFVLDDGSAFMYFKKTAPGIIVHESCHAVFGIFDYCGVPTISKNDEIFAYTLDHIFTNVTAALKKLK